MQTLKCFSKIFCAPHWKYRTFIFRVNKKNTRGSVHAPVWKLSGNFEFTLHRTYWKWILLLPSFQGKSVTFYSLLFHLYLQSTVFLQVFAWQTFLYITNQSNYPPFLNCIVNYDYQSFQSRLYLQQFFEDHFWALHMLKRFGDIYLLEKQLY